MPRKKRKYARRRRNGKKTDNFLLYAGGAATAALGYFGWKHYKKQTTCDHLDADGAFMAALLPLIDTQDPSTLPQTRGEYRARILEALWAVNPDCRGKTPRRVTKSFIEPTETLGFEDFVSDMWEDYQNA